MTDELIDREWHRSYLEHVEQENVKLRERIAVLEKVKEAAECTQEGNLYSSDLYKALKQSGSGK